MLTTRNYTLIQKVNIQLNKSTNKQKTNVTTNGGRKVPVLKN